MESLGELGDSLPVLEMSAFAAFYDHLSQTKPIFAKLMELKEKGWKNTKGDEYFKYRRQRADGASKEGATMFFQMMKEIGDEMQLKTGAFTQARETGDDFMFLDLCMAPGGYTFSALKYNRGAKACGITLPPSQGGHEVLLKVPNSTVLYEDITLFATEFGVDEIPIDHPAPESFSTEANESTRLITPQLILALQRIREGGTLIMLLHRIEAIDSFGLLYTFSRFSDIEVFKPVKKHAIMSTFYLIAKNFQPDTEAATEALEDWKTAWPHATFRGEGGTGEGKIDIDEECAEMIVDLFDGRYTELARPIWSIQFDALSKSEFI